MMLWLAPSPHSKTVLGLNQPAGAFLWNLHLLPVPAWLPTGYSGCVSQSTALHTRLNPNMPVGDHLSDVSVCCRLLGVTGESIAKTPVMAKD